MRVQGHDDQALVEFQHAWAVSPTPRARAQIALAEQALGNWLDAADHLHEAMASAHDPWIASHLATLESAQQAIEAHLGRLDVAANVPAELWIAGHRVATLPMTESVHVVAGSTPVEVRAAGYVTMRRMLDVTAGQSSREVFELVPVTASAQANPGTGGGGGTVTPPASSRPFPVGPVVVMGVGAVALISSAVFFGLRGSALSGCTVSGNVATCDTPAHEQAAMGGGTYNTVGDILLVGGGVVLVGGAAWLLIDRLAGHRDADHARLQGGPDLAHGGFVLRGEF